MDSRINIKEFYASLIKKNKDEDQKKKCDEDFTKLWSELPLNFFENKQFQKKSDNNEIYKNKYLENENLNFEIKKNSEFELYLKIIKYKEQNTFPNENNYETNYYNKSDNDEFPSSILFLITEIKSLQKTMYSNSNKNELISIKKKIELYLFMIFMILKNYPFYFVKRQFLEDSFSQLQAYRNWPIPIGCHGYNLFKLFIDDLYLPGTTILNEIREKYLLDFIDPNKFLLIRDDFLKYYYLNL